MKPVLYISYDGILDPLGQSQIQPYVKGLAGLGVPMHVLSFEKPQTVRSDELCLVAERFRTLGIGWTRLRYHKRPAVFSTLWDIFRGTLAALWITVRRKVRVIHARSYIAALIALFLCLPTRLRFLFDMRGFWADERVEGGIWPAGGVLYRVFKRLERSFLCRADAVVILTRRGSEVLREMNAGPLPPVEVIPTCVDLELFHPPEKKEQLDNRIKLIYLGSFGTWYLVEEMIAFYKVLAGRLPESSFTLVTPSDPGLVRKAADRVNMPAAAREKMTVTYLPYTQVPKALARADCSIFFIRPSFAKQASCATKLAESLACGLPVLINSGIGDQDREVESRRVGVVLEELNEENYCRAVDNLVALLADKSLSSRCRAAAEEDFSLERAVGKYLELYRNLWEKGEIRS